MGKKIQYIGRYLMDGRTLGKGNFARVELATHGITKCKVAVKIIDTRKIRESYVRKNLHREARILSQLRHPNVIRLYETLKASSFYCLVLENASGGELLSYIRSQKDSRLTENQAWPFIRQLVSALYYMHERGVVHRDLKMENILLDEKKRTIKIVDFGLSNIYKSEEPLRTHCGSPEYAAPELFINNQTYGPEVDLWSLGINMYALVVGKLPFTAAYSDEYRRQKLLKQIQKGLIAQHYKEMIHLTIDCQSLLRGLIESDSEDRITIREIQNHPWITKLGHCPFHHYTPPPQDHALRAQVVEDLSCAMDLDVTSVDSIVNEFRSDELSAMFNMMLDHRKAVLGLDEDSRLRRDSALSSFDGSFPSTSNSLQCTPEAYRAKHNCTPSPDFHSSRSSSGHGSMRSSRFSREYSLKSSNQSPRPRERIQHGDDRRCNSCDLPDSKLQLNDIMQSSRSMSPVDRNTHLLVKSQVHSSPKHTRRQETKAQNCVSPKRSPYQDSKHKHVRLSRLEQMRQKLFSAMADARQQATGPFSSVPKPTYFVPRPETTVQYSDQQDSVDISNPDHENPTVESENYTVAPHASPEDTSLGSDTSVISPCSWSSRIPVRCKSIKSPDDWVVEEVEPEDLMSSPEKSPRPPGQGHISSHNLSDEEKLSKSVVKHKYYKPEATNAQALPLVKLPLSTQTCELPSPSKEIVYFPEGMSVKRKMLDRKARGCSISQGYSSMEDVDSTPAQAQMWPNIAGNQPLGDEYLEESMMPLPCGLVAPALQSTSYQAAGHSIKDKSTRRPCGTSHASQSCQQSQVDGGCEKRSTRTKTHPASNQSCNPGSQTATLHLPKPTKTVSDDLPVLPQQLNANIPSAPSGNDGRLKPKSAKAHAREQMDRQAQWKQKIAKILKKRLQLYATGTNRIPPVGQGTYGSSRTSAAVSKTSATGHASSVDSQDVQIKPPHRVVKKKQTPGGSLAKGKHSVFSNPTVGQTHQVLFQPQDCLERNRPASLCGLPRAGPLQHDNRYLHMSEHQFRHLHPLLRSRALIRHQLTLGKSGCA